MKEQDPDGIREAQLDAIRKKSKPIASLKPLSIVNILQVMLYADGSTVVEGVPEGNIAIVRAEGSERAMAVFGSERALKEFATKYGLTIAAKA